jgi:hypothetical protein
MDEKGRKTERPRQARQIIDFKLTHYLETHETKDSRSQSPTESKHFRTKILVSRALANITEIGGFVVTFVVTQPFL